MRRNMPAARENICALFLFCAITSITSPAQVFTTLFEFDGTTNGGGPSNGPLVQGLDGDLYGNTVAGAYTNPNPTAYKITSSGALTTIHVFSGTDGGLPEGLVQATNGKLYGATNVGGGFHKGCLQSGCGTVYAITSSGTLTTLHSFDSTDGNEPFDPLVQAADGNLYGTTAYGGVSAIPPCKSNDYAGCGTVFKITPAGTLTTLHVFCLQQGCPDGHYPQAPLLQASNGLFYGTTVDGGSGQCTISGHWTGCGTVFQISAAGVFTVLHKFLAPDGEGPDTALVQGTDGKLYGTTSYGGAYGYGTIFTITSSGAFTKLHDFSSTDGEFAEGFIQATDGNFYGTAAQGGANGYGTIFQFTSAGAFTVLHSFAATEGQNPFARLVQVTNGIFYGTTVQGGIGECGGLGLGCGTVFSFDMGLGPFVTFVMNAGKVGHSAEVLGQGFAGTAIVSFNGVPASFKVESDTFLTAIVPTGASTGYVAVETASGTLTSNVAFQVIP